MPSVVAPQCAASRCARNARAIQSRRVVRPFDVAGVEIGRGLTRLGAFDVARTSGRRREELAAWLGGDGSETVVVHKDDLVLAGRWPASAASAGGHSACNRPSRPPRKTVINTQ
jgi:hypothetical protein